MVKLGLKPLKRNKRKYSSYKGTVGKIADNLSERDFNGEVVSYNTSKSLNLEQKNDMLNKAFDKNND